MAEAAAEALKNPAPAAAAVGVPVPVATMAMAVVAPRIVDPLASVGGDATAAAPSSCSNPDTAGIAEAAEREFFKTLMGWGVKPRAEPRRVLSCKGCDRKTTDSDPVFDGEQFKPVLGSYTPFATIWGYYSTKLKGFDGQDQPSGDFCCYCDKGHRAGWSHLTRQEMLKKLSDPTFKHGAWSSHIDGVVEALVSNVQAGRGFNLNSAEVKRSVTAESEEWTDIKKEGRWLRIDLYTSLHGNPKKNGKKHIVRMQMDPLVKQMKQFVFIPNDEDGVYTGTFGVKGSLKDARDVADDSSGRLDLVDEAMASERAASSSVLPNSLGPTWSDMLEDEVYGSVASSIRGGGSGAPETPAPPSSLASAEEDDIEDPAYVAYMRQLDAGRAGSGKASQAQAQSRKRQLPASPAPIAESTPVKCRRTGAVSSPGNLDSAAGISQANSPAARAASAPVVLRSGGGGDIDEALIAAVGCHRDIVFKLDWSWASPENKTSPGIDTKFIQGALSAMETLKRTVNGCTRTKDQALKSTSTNLKALANKAKSKGLKMQYACLYVISDAFNRVKRVRAYLLLSRVKCSWEAVSGDIDAFAALCKSLCIPITAAWVKQWIKIRHGSIDSTQHGSFLEVILGNVRVSVSDDDGDTGGSEQGEGEGLPSDIGSVADLEVFCGESCNEAERREFTRELIVFTLRYLGVETNKAPGESALYLFCKGLATACERDSESDRASEVMPWPCLEQFLALVLLRDERDADSGKPVTEERLKKLLSLCENPEVELSDFKVVLQTPVGKKMVLAFVKSVRRVENDSKVEPMAATLLAALQKHEEQISKGDLSAVMGLVDERADGAEAAAGAGAAVGGDENAMGGGSGFSDGEGPVAQLASAFNKLKNMCSGLADIRAATEKMPSDQASKHAHLVAKAKLALKTSDASLTVVVKACFARALGILAETKIESDDVKAILGGAAECQTILNDFRTSGASSTFAFGVDLLNVISARLEGDIEVMPTDKQEALLDKYHRSFETKRAVELQQDVLGSDGAKSLKTIMSQLAPMMNHARELARKRLAEVYELDVFTKAAADTDTVHQHTDCARWLQNANLTRTHYVKFGIDPAAVDITIGKLKDLAMKHRQLAVDQPVRDAIASVQAILASVDGYESFSIEDLNSKLLSPDLCNALPLQYSDLMAKSKARGVSDEFVQGGKTCSRAAILAMSTCSGLQVVQRADPKEAAAFEQSRLRAHGLTISDLPLSLQQAVQALVILNA